MSQRFTGAELALLHMRLLHFGQASLADPVRISADGPALPLADAAEVLAARRRPLVCRSSGDGDTLVVAYEVVPEPEVREHYAWVAARLAESRGTYAPDAPDAPLCLVAGWDAAVLGTARWEDVLDWIGVFTGDAWRGGIAAAEADRGAACAAELSIGAPPAGGRSAGPGADAA